MGLPVHDPCVAWSSEPSRAEPEMDGSDVFDGEAVDCPSEVAATINVGTAAAQAMAIIRLKRIVPFPLIEVDKARVPDAERIMYPCVCEV
ncbi:MAG: hypothetical protein ACRDNM_06085 [Gaiellaceae bacterium]